MKILQSSKCSRVNVVLAVIVVIAACSLPLMVVADANAGPPNVVIIMTDDMGYSDLGCFGGEMRTPHLDSLARGGLRFTNFYSENMCWVSRASLLTGIYHTRSLRSSTIAKQCITLPEALHANGYATRMAGKWHLPGKKNSVYPIDRGFEHWYGILGGASSFFAPHSLSRDRKNIESEYKDKDYYFTHAISDNAVKYISETKKEQPLFLYVAYTAAHWPLHALPEDIQAYKGKFSKGWDELRVAQLKRMKELGVIGKDVKLSPRNPSVPSWADEKNKAWQQRRMEVYAAQVTSMDRGVGQIIDALKKAGRFDNTLMLFTIDNGGCHVEYGTNRKGSYLPEKTRDGKPMKPGNIPGLMPGPENTYQSYGYGWANLSNTPFRLFKQYDHEGGIHTPMIAHWPKGIPASDRKGGGIVEHTSHLIDIMPTVLRATKTKLPETLNGQRRVPVMGLSLMPSLNPKLQDSKQQTHEAIYFSHAKGKAMRQGDWKLVRTGRGKWELYNLKEDPNELNDQANEYAKKAEAMQRQFSQWQKEMTRDLKKN